MGKGKKHGNQSKSDEIWKTFITHAENGFRI